jgi:hypothetical protein
MLYKNFLNHSLLSQQKRIMAVETAEQSLETAKLLKKDIQHNLHLLEEEENKLEDKLYRVKEEKNALGRKNFLCDRYLAEYATKSTNIPCPVCYVNKGKKFFGYCECISKP